MFFQGLRYWEFYDLRMRVRRGAKLIARWLRCPKEETEELKIETYPSSVDKAPDPKAGDAAEHKLKKGESAKDAACSLKNISLMLLCFVSLLHYHRFSSG